MHKQYHSEYYQAIIQLRPADKDLINFVERRIEKSKNSWISKIVYLKNGIDYYISSNKMARQIGKQLKMNFDGELKESTKLYSRDRLSSKDLHRVTVCFRLRKEE